jgi:hypothetical protein
MTPTRTLSAVLVWLRASERISVTDLGIGSFGPSIRRAVETRPGLVPAMTKKSSQPRAACRESGGASICLGGQHT